MTAIPGICRAQAIPRVGPVQVQMQGVHFRIDSAIVLQIGYLRGELLPGEHKGPPLFDDNRSFVLGIDSARIAIGTADLARLLNQYTFAYKGSPLKSLTLSVENDRLVQEGKLRGMSFKVAGRLSITEKGEIRLHPEKVKALGIPVDGLMELFGLQLQRMVDLREARGVRLEKNDFILTPSQLLPPPRVRGTVASVELSDSSIVQVFRPRDGTKVQPLHPPREKGENYMFFRGGVLRFGKLTMNGADLEIVDADPGDPFDFFLDQYNKQLVAGFDKNTPDHGLIVTMPDFSDLTKPRQRRTAVRPAHDSLHQRPVSSHGLVQRRVSGRRVGAAPGQLILRH